MSIWNYANPQLKDLVAYEPGKPIEDVARERGLKPEDIIKLASNENPLGPSPKALAAVRAALARVRALTAAGDVTPYVLYAQTGGAATTGQAIIVIEFEGGWTT